VLLVALAAAAVKLYLAATTHGTNDVGSFEAFAKVIRHHGVYGVYGVKIIGHPVYNHPPLVGWTLLLFSHLSDLGISFRFLIRVPATLADIASALLVFELVRSRRPLVEAAVAGVMVGCSPALIVISGFHGNTDPVFVMFAILSLYLLVTERSGVLAGMSFAAALSMKIIPIVALPVLLLIAARAGRRRLGAFLAGSGALLAILWLPAVIGYWSGFKQNVLGYKGVPGKWGLIEFTTNNLHWSHHRLDLLTGPGRWPMLLLSTFLPLFVAWRRPSASIPAFGMTLVLVLLLSTASSGGRYLVWAIAAAFLVDVPTGALYDIGASIVVVMVYNRWNGGWPWDRAVGSAWTHVETFIAGLTWFALLAVAIRGAMNLRVPAPPVDEHEALDLDSAAEGAEPEKRLAPSDLN
jgi:hypothetical protein